MNECIIYNCIRGVKNYKYFVDWNFAQKLFQYQTVLLEKLIISVGVKI